MKIGKSKENEIILPLISRPPLHAADVPMSIADSYQVRLTEILPGPAHSHTGSDFKIHRRLGRRVTPRERLEIPPTSMKTERECLLVGADPAGSA